MSHFLCMLKISKKSPAALTHCRGDVHCQEAGSADFLEHYVPLSKESLIFALPALIYCLTTCLHISISVM